MDTLKVNTVIILLIATVLTSGCRPTNPKITANNLNFDTIKVYETYKFFNNTAEPGGELRISYLYPKSGLNQEQVATVERIFAKSFFGNASENLPPKEAVKILAGKILNDFKQMEDDYKAERSILHDHAEEVEEGDSGSERLLAAYEYIMNEVLFNGNNILSFAISTETYSGGAHGSHNYNCYNIDLVNGVLFTEQDVFVDGYESELASIIVDMLTKQNGLAKSSELEDIGVFSVDEIRPNKNFSIGKDAIEYYFNEYEIAAYAMGLITVKLPYTLIRHLLRTDSPVYTLVE